MNLKELLEKRAALVAQMQALHEKTVAESRALTADEATEWDRLDGECKLLTGQIEREKQMAQMRAYQAQSMGTVVGAQGGEARSRAPGSPAVLRYGLGDDEARAAAHYLRTGDPSGLIKAQAEERAYNNTDMNIGTQADGGYAVPTGMYNQIIARRDETLLAPRLGVRDIPGKGLTVNVPIDDEADVLFSSLAEAGTVLQDAPALNQKAFTLVKYTKFMTLSWELLRDEDASLLSFVNDWIGRGVAATENNALLIEARASGTAGLTLDAAAAIGMTEIPEFVGKLAPEYQNGAQWVLNPGTVAYIQGLSGTSNWYFSPQPGNYAGKPTLWGYPVEQSSYATAYAASAKSLLFGNWSFMGRRQSTTINMLRDPYTAAGTGQIKLWFWFDVVYGVLQAEAIQYATHPSA